MPRERIGVLALCLLFGIMSNGVLAFPEADRDVSVPAPSWTAKVHSRVLEARGEEAPLDFLVVLTEQTAAEAVGRRAGPIRSGTAVVEALRDVAARSQAPLIELIESHGGEFRAFWVANLVHVRGDAKLLEAIAQRDDVRRIDANPRVRAADPMPSRASAPTVKRGVGAQWNISQIGADAVWQLGFTGQGVVVAAQDTGFDWDHEALMPQYRGWDAGSGQADHAYNWHDAIHSGGGQCGADSAEPCADISHGTHVMGTIAGDDGGVNRTGVAPGARWIGCRNMDEGDGTPATYIECFEWFLAPTDAAGDNPDPSLAPHVINNSWICPTSEGCEADTLKLVVENVRAAGIVVVGGAGNSGGSGCSSVVAPPAIYDATFSIGATDSGDQIAGFSSRGPVTADGSGRTKPDVVAPGVSVNSSTPNDGYAAWSGTSMASPHVAGVVALLLSARPDLKGRVDEIESIIEQTALRLTTSTVCGDDIPGETIPNNVYGWGRVDAFLAISGDPDEDTVSTMTDCRPTDPGSWALPAPAVDLTLTQNAATTLTWADSLDPGAIDVTYTVIRSTSPDEFAAATCLTHALDHAAADNEVPEALFYYLVQVENACGATAGVTAAGAPRATATCP